MTRTFRCKIYINRNKNPRFLCNFVSINRVLYRSSIKPITHSLIPMLGLSTLPLPFHFISLALNNLKANNFFKIKTPSLCLSVYLTAAVIASSSPFPSLRRCNKKLTASLRTSSSVPIKPNRDLAVLIRQQQQQQKASLSCNLSITWPVSRLVVTRRLIW